MNDSLELLLIDSHIHLDLYKDPLMVINAAESCGIKLLSVTNAPFLFKHCQQVWIPKTSRHYIALGMHPELVPEYGDQINLFAELLGFTNFVGEVGLDYVAEKNRNNQRAQRKIFEKIMTLCFESKNKVISIHSRGAMSDINSIIGNKYPGTIILHWFSGTILQLELALECGYYFSINSAMLRSQQGRTIIDKIPLSKILLETDGPFISINSQPVLPPNILTVADEIAKLKRISGGEMLKIISANCRSIAQYDNRG